MSNPMELPIVHINNYIWDLARGNVVGQPAAPSAVWNTSLYTFTPFYPVSETLAPESATTPFILYDYIFMKKAGTFWPLEKEEAEYIIVGDIPQIFYLKNYIIDALQKFDESAQEVNNHLLSASPTVKFKYISADQERYIADERRIESLKPKFITCVNICYEYTK